MAQKFLPNNLEEKLAEYKKSTIILMDLFHADCQGYTRLLSMRKKLSEHTPIQEDMRKLFNSEAYVWRNNKQSLLDRATKEHTTLYKEMNKVKNSLTGKVKKMFAEKLKDYNDAYRKVNSQL